MKSIFIFGGGITGMGALDFCLKQNIQVKMYDDNKEKIPPQYFTDYTDFNFTKIDAILLSPGIQKNHPLVKKAIECGVEIITDIDLFFKFKSSSVKVIGVTGSNGKSTTVSLLKHILEEEAFLAGNIGISPLQEPAFNAKFCILELSSFQLESIKTKPDASILLNIKEDHLNYHHTMQNYVNAKVKIINPLGMNFVFDECENYTKEDVIKLSVNSILENGYSLIENNFYNNGKLIASLPQLSSTMMGKRHNLCNILACFAMCVDFCKMKPEDVLNKIASFKGLEHRIEVIAKNNQNILFVNDSKATNPDATITALNCFNKQNIFLIAGGVAKSKGIEELFNEPAFKYVKEVLLIGTAAASFAKKIIEHNKTTNHKVKYLICASLEDAVKNAINSAKKLKESVVLLSPLCASFDMFKNFEERGKKFKLIVKEYL